MFCVFSAVDLDRLDLPDIIVECGGDQWDAVVYREVRPVGGRKGEGVGSFY